MAFTGQLGGDFSLLGNIQLGAGEGEVANPLEQLVEQSLDFVQDIVLGGPVPGDGSNALVLLQSATYVVHRARTVSQTLTLVQTALSGLIATPEVEDDLGLTDDATYTRDAIRPVSQSLAFVQDATATNSNIRITVEQSIAFTDEATQRGPIYMTVNQSLNLFQDEEGHAGVVNKTITQALAFTQRAGRVIEISVTQALAFVQAGARKNIITQVLSFVQTVRVGKGGDVEQDLGLTQVLSRILILNRTIGQSLNLNQSVTYRLSNGCLEKTYSPFVGGSSDSSYTPPSTTAPTLGRDTLTLTYPYISPTTTLELRSPEFGNKDRLAFNRINRETRGGTLIVFADPKWPKSQVLVLQVDHLKHSQVVELLEFLAESLGKEIGLLDWEGRQWRGIITTPDATVTHVGRHDRSVAFDFRGTLV